MHMPRTFIITLLLASAAVSCSKKINDLDRTGLKGTVRSVSQVRCDPTYREDRWVAGKPTSGQSSILLYDRDGYYSAGYVLSEKGDTIGKSTFTRQNGEVVEENQYARSPSFPGSAVFNQTSRTKLERVSDDQVNFEIWDGNRMVSQGANFYNSKGHILRQVQAVNDREVVIHYVYKKGMLVENYQEESDGSRSATQLYDYVSFDSKGNWTEMLVYLENEKIKPGVVIKREIEYY